MDQAIVRRTGGRNNPPRLLLNALLWLAANNRFSPHVRIDLPSAMRRCAIERLEGHQEG
jgi:hypothetical protein